MDEEYKRYIRPNLSTLVEHIKVLDIMPYLPCLTDRDKERIRARRNQDGDRVAAEELLDSLRRRENWFNVFMEALCNPEVGLLPLAKKLNPEHRCVVEAVRPAPAPRDAARPQQQIYNFSGCSNVQIGSNNQQTVGNGASTGDQSGHNESLRSLGDESVVIERRNDDDANVGAEPFGTQVQPRSDLTHHISLPLEADASARVSNEGPNANDLSLGVVRGTYSESRDSQTDRKRLEEPPPYTKDPQPGERSLGMNQQTLKSSEGSQGSEEEVTQVKQPDSSSRVGRGPAGPGGRGIPAPAVGCEQPGDRTHSAVVYERNVKMQAVEKTRDYGRPTAAASIGNSEKEPNKLEKQVSDPNLLDTRNDHYLKNTKNGHPTVRVPMSAPSSPAVTVSGQQPGSSDPLPAPQRLPGDEPLPPGRASPPFPAPQLQLRTAALFPAPQLPARTAAPVPAPQLPARTAAPFPAPQLPARTAAPFPAPQLPPPLSLNLHENDGPRSDYTNNFPTCNTSGCQTSTCQTRDARNNRPTGRAPGAPGMRQNIPGNDDNVRTEEVESSSVELGSQFYPPGERGNTVHRAPRPVANSQLPDFSKFADFSVNSTQTEAESVKSQEEKEQTAANSTDKNTEVTSKADDGAEKSHSPKARRDRYLDDKMSVFLAVIVVLGAFAIHKYMRSE